MASQKALAMRLYRAKRKAEGKPPDHRTELARHQRYIELQMRHEAGAPKLHPVAQQVYLPPVGLIARSFLGTVFGRR